MEVFFCFLLVLLIIIGLVRLVSGPMQGPEEAAIDKIVELSNIKFEREQDRKKRREVAVHFLSSLDQRNMQYYCDYQVMGGWYRSDAAKQVHRLLTSGERVSLKQDPNNSYDDYAVKVVAKHCFIGYLESGSVEAYVALERGLVDKVEVLRNDGYPSDIDGLYVRVIFEREALTHDTFINYFIPDDDDYERFGVSKIW